MTDLFKLWSTLSLIVVLCFAFLQEILLLYIFCHMTVVNICTTGNVSRGSLYTPYRATINQQCLSCLSSKLHLCIKHHHDNCITLVAIIPLTHHKTCTHFIRYCAAHVSNDTRDTRINTNPLPPSFYERWIIVDRIRQTHIKPI